MTRSEFDQFASWWDANKGHLVKTADVWPPPIIYKAQAPKPSRTKAPKPNAIMPLQGPRMSTEATTGCPKSDLAATMKKILVGQDKAVDTIIPFVHMWQAGFCLANRPIGVILLLGPTGTGKTRTIEALAQAMLGSDGALTRIDCAEFQHSHEIAKLVGSPPGYLGHRETGAMLSQEILNRHHQDDGPKINFLVFDEIEKASDALWNLCLGIFDKSSLTLGDNRKVSFNDTLIFLTTNLGAKAIERANAGGFGFHGQKHENDTDRIGMKATRDKFTPEFVNRLDAVIPYEALSREAFRSILQIMLGEFKEKRQFKLVVTPAAEELLLDLGTSEKYGARELRRAIQRNIVQPIAAKIVNGKLLDTGTIVVDAVDKEFQIGRG